MKIERNARNERSSTNSSANAEAARNKQNKSHSDPYIAVAGRHVLPPARSIK
jgi:hypothetical protein